MLPAVVTFVASLVVAVIVPMCYVRFAPRMLKSSTNVWMYAGAILSVIFMIA